MPQLNTCYLTPVSLHKYTPGMTAIRLQRHSGCSVSSSGRSEVWPQRVWPN